MTSNPIFSQLTHLSCWPSSSVAVESDGQLQPAHHEGRLTYVVGWSYDKADIEQLWQWMYQTGERWIIYPTQTLLGRVIQVFASTLAMDVLKQRLSQSSFNFDALICDHIPSLNRPGMLVMDMDSTTIEIECIDEIAKLAGVGEQVSAVTARAMRGELDFRQSLTHRVAQLKGAPKRILDEVASQLPLMPGCELLLSHLQVNGWKVILASGGFTYFADVLRRQLGFDQSFANQLVIDGDYLTGEVTGDIVDAAYKVNLLKTWRERYHIDPSQTMAVGDGANDLPMLAESALGVALHAKPIVQAQAKVAINHSNLEGLLFLLIAGQVISTG
ncbi:phosphoserine phosphatase SerB [Celerinatantimonas yamalensis]|uniref:Phosphoserine phosphatase n=1 Tax=Celerinatantimonas yamalensis TaxID=559956 RepID=A0ABW9GAF8_9GAMM